MKLLKILIKKINVVFLIIIISLLFPLIGCTKSGKNDVDPSDIRYQKAIQSLVKEALIRKEIIEKQFDQLKADMGDAIYDYFCSYNDTSLNGYHYKYDISSVISILKKYSPETDLTKLQKCFFPFVNPELCYNARWYVYNQTKNEEDAYKSNVLVVVANNFKQVHYDYIEHIVTCQIAFMQIGFDVCWERDISSIDTTKYLSIIDVSYLSNSEFEKQQGDDIAGVFLSDKSSCSSFSGYSITRADGTQLYVPDFSTRTYDWSKPKIVIKEEYLDSYRDNRSWWEKVIGKEYRELNTSNFAVVFIHEMGHFLGLDDLYVKEGYNDDDYHPNTGKSIMAALYEQSCFFERDTKNIDYIYDGTYITMLDRIEKEVRDKYK